MTGLLWAAGACFTAAYKGWMDNWKFLYCIFTWPIVLGEAIKADIEAMKGNS